MKQLRIQQIATARPHHPAQLTTDLCEEHPWMDMSGYRSRMRRVHFNCQVSPINSYVEYATHDLRKGSPRLQLYRNPFPGGSVATRFGEHWSTELIYVCEPKSRGSMLNIFPPILKASVCTSLHGYVLLPNRLITACTTSCGPRIKEFP